MLRNLHGAEGDLTTGVPTQARDELEYPSRDGRPMGETDTHRDEIMAAIECLKARYADQEDVYVAGDLLLYYEEGNPKARIAPDVFVVFGVPKHRRRTYKLWKEGRAPAFVLEVTSRGTWLEDAGNKKALSAKLGVSEYFLFDPEAEYLEPPLQGWRLVQGEYRPLVANASGALESRALGLGLSLSDLRLRLTDLGTGESLLRPEELHRARREAEAARRDAEAGR